MFEEEYTKLITLDKYRENQNKDLEVPFTHNGYFASDRKKGKIVYKDTNGNTKPDDDAYNLIMKDKKKLLSMDNSLWLTVMANESYSEFVSGLQSEIERDTNIRFGIVEKHSFANVKRADNDNFGETIYMGYDKS